MINRKNKKVTKTQVTQKIGNLTSYALKLHNKPNISHNSSINRDVHLEKITKKLQMYIRLVNLSQGLVAKANYYRVS